MMLQPALTLQLAVVVPLLAAVGILSAHRHPNLREGISIVAGVVLCYLTLAVYFALDSGAVITVQWIELLPGLPLLFKADALGVLFALVAGFLWLVTTVYAIGYMRAHREANQSRFYACFAVAMSGAMGVAYAGNLLTMFVFYEILTLSTYPLVAHAGTSEAKRGARCYLGFLFGTSIAFLLSAIIGTWLVAGSVEFRHGGVFADDVSTAAAAVLLLLYILGIGKAAIMPFHRWLPAAMVAPTPVSALLHAVAVVKAGVFCILKVCVFVFGIDLLPALPTTTALLYLASASIVIASLIAMRQDNLKKRLAYSTVSQLNYITLGALLASASGVVGGAMHIATHAFGKITLFFCAGSILLAANKTMVSQMRGLGRQMPWTMAAFFIGSLSIVGVPPAGGSWSKWYLLLGTLQAEYWIPAAVLILSSILNMVYLLPVSVRAFFPAQDWRSDTGMREAPWPCLLAVVVTSVGCIALFVYPGTLHHLATSILTGAG